jgi:hypothetical protein
MRRGRGGVWLAGILSVAVSSIAVTPAQCARTIVRGTNLVSFPMTTPLTTAQDVCNVFGKSTSATIIRQFDGLNVFSWACLPPGGATGFLLRASQGIGVMVIESATPATGVIVGLPNPAQLVTIPDAGPFPRGIIVYDYPDTTCDVSSRDVCQEAGMTLTGPAPLILRYGPLGIVDASYTCDQTAVPGFALRFCGEGVLVQGEVNGPKVFLPNVPPC